MASYESDPVKTKRRRDQAIDFVRRNSVNVFNNGVSAYEIGNAALHGEKSRPNWTKGATAALGLRIALQLHQAGLIAHTRENRFVATPQRSSGHTE
ncbi:MAG: hypothetical protein KF723_14120 [Rhizobiaceae bacterium]|nr:hypothetical protein [Rhizobiaceae bacterium]